MLKFLKHVLAFMALIIQIGLGQALADELIRKFRHRRIVRRMDKVRRSFPVNGRHHPTYGSQDYSHLGFRPRGVPNEYIFDQHVKDALKVTRGERD